MLVISRNEGETTILTLPDGREGTLTVLDVRRRRGVMQVRLGFDLPRDVKIVRPEILPPEGEEVGRAE